MSGINDSHISSGCEDPTPPSISNAFLLCDTCEDGLEHTFSLFSLLVFVYDSLVRAK